MHPPEPMPGIVAVCQSAFLYLVQFLENFPGFLRIFFLKMYEILK